MAIKLPLKMTTAAVKTNTAWVIININKSQHDNVDTTVLGQYACAQQPSLAALLSFLLLLIEQSECLDTETNKCGGFRQG